MNYIYEHWLENLELVIEVNNIGHADFNIYIIIKSRQYTTRNFYMILPEVYMKKTL